MTDDRHDNTYEDTGEVTSGRAALAYAEPWCEIHACSLCGGDLVPLGTLGKLDWYRCRACGIDQSILG